MTDAAEPSLDAHALNYVGWYRHRVSTDMNATISLYDALKEMYEDFGGLTLKPQGGGVEHLFASVGVSEEQGKPKFVTYSFSELSEGERALVILYTLLQLVRDPDMTLCLDEPDNFLALAEIQPWLLDLKSAMGANGSQSILISHHPELIDYLAPTCGLMFEREKNGPVRVKRFEAETGDQGLAPSEIIARGWE
jgi:ABC-type glutathione transport system ATPase component